MLEIVTSINKAVNGFVWGPVMLVLLVGTGIYLTFRTGGVQVRWFGYIMKNTIGSLFRKSDKDHGNNLTPFQAVTTALAGTVGTGNIAGVTGAIFVGGPGAVFWMWISAFFGMSTIYGEAVLAQTYKTTVDGQVTGGPIYYIKAAFKGKFGTFLAGFFSIAIILALGFMGNMVQSNSIGEACNTAFGIPNIAIGIVVALVAAFIFLGGVKRIASVTEKLVPIMAVLYILGCIAILCINHATLLNSIKQIFVLAFNPQAMAGGVLGVTIKEAMRFGVARGLFSNEAGMGSTPHAHALAKVEKPQDQGCIAMIGVFIDTFIILTLTALVIISSGVMTPGLTGTKLAQAAFSAAFGHFGNIFIAVCMLFFAFSTIIGWYFFGETNVKALFGAKATKFYAAIVVLFVVLGSSLKVDLVWVLSDFFNGLMVLPNLIGVVALTGVIVRISKGQNIKESPLVK